MLIFQSFSASATFTHPAAGLAARRAGLVSPDAGVAWQARQVISSLTGSTAIGEASSFAGGVAAP